LRVKKNALNVDEGILFNLKSIPENAKSLILFTNFNNVDKYND